MISREWIESTKLHPAIAQRYSCVSIKTANVLAHHWNLIEIEGQNGWNAHS